MIMTVFIVTIAVGVQDRPSAAPKTGVWVSDYKIVASPSFAKLFPQCLQLSLPMQAHLHSFL
jgi:hypothetical protein